MKKDEDFLRLEGKENVNIDFENLRIKKRRWNPFFLLALIVLVIATAFAVIKIKSNEKGERNEESVLASKDETDVEWQGAFANESVFLKCRQSSVFVVANGKACSGFIFSSDGWIVSTNGAVNEFVKGKVKVVLCDGSVHEVTAFKESRRAGLVLMKIEAKNLVPVDLSFGGELSAGQEIYTFCSLDGKGEPSLFSGQISHTESEVTVVREGQRNKVFSLMQVSLLLTETGEGAPLFDENGKLIGICCGSGEEGKYMINYAFSIKKIRNLLQKMKDGAYFDDNLYGFILE